MITMTTAAAATTMTMITMTTATADMNIMNMMTTADVGMIIMGIITTMPMKFSPALVRKPDGGILLRKSRRRCRHWKMKKNTA